MRDHLRGDVVQQIGVIVIGNIVEIDQRADDIIFEAKLSSVRRLIAVSVSC